MAEAGRRVILVQHALALSDKEDPERPVSSEGMESTGAVVAMLSESRSRNSGPLAEIVVHSGKLRAQQTAEILASGLGATAVEARPGLSPNDDPAAFWKTAEADAGSGTMAVVGHLPFMERLAGLLVAGDPSKPPVAFSNSAPVCLETDAAGLWRVKWILTPGLTPPPAP